MMDDNTLAILFGDEFRDFWGRVKPFTMVSEERAYATYKACRHVCVHDIPGDFVECGVYRGGMAMLAGLTFGVHSKRPRQIYLFDTFAGMTAPGEPDVDRQGMAAVTALAAEPDMCLAGLDEVQLNLQKIDFPRESIHFVEGDVIETLGEPRALPATIAVLRLDTDWYESTRMELDILYPRVARYGVVLIDDYGHWLGARKAVDEFVAASFPPIYLARTDSTGVEFAKP